MGAINGLSVGRSWTVNLNTPDGELIIPTITAFNIRATPVNDESTAVDGFIRYVTIPHGYSGMIEMDRSNDVIELYWTTYENQYYTGQNLLPSTITQTIQEPDGNVTQWIASGVMFDADDFGQWTGTTIVKQRLNFRAFRWEQQL